VRPIRSSSGSSEDDRARLPLTGTIHVLTQFAWPDDAPTGIYSEQLADALGAAGVRVRLACGVGTYRVGTRPAPRTPIERLPHGIGRRESLLSVAIEFDRVRRCFSRYLATQVQAGDTVVLSSAPPTTLRLHRLIHSRGARGIYWLQDFYPELIRPIWDPPAAVRQRLRSFWIGELGRWDLVIKAAGNLDYDGSNAVVVRNWPTLDLGSPRLPRPKTALYSGNLGWIHHLGSFLTLCDQIRADGFEVTVRGDGPGMTRLPTWIRTAPPLASVDELIDSYWSAEVHLVAGDPRFPGAVFPSKFWNALATGRRVLASGFAPPMLAELQASREADFTMHLPALVDLVLRVADQAAGPGALRPLGPSPPVREPAAGAP
jgi:hypothetical protein